jgi:hypothetical protein
MDMPNNVRINKFGGSKPRQDRRALRREEAVARNEYYASLTPERRLANLDFRLGKGTGAHKQRARLAREIAGR